MPDFCWYQSRTDVIFHAKRGLQEFSYDTLKSIKSQELTIPDSLSLTIPQDYVNYVKLSAILPEERKVKEVLLFKDYSLVFIYQIVSHMKRIMLQSF